MSLVARLLLLALLAFASPAAAETVDLIGTWYVLVHYKDDDSANPEQERWDDKVWVFARKGSRLRWTEYPIVVFDDEYGRFERRSTGQYARILHYWEPNETQLGDIADGLQVNDRGSKKKTLRGSDANGWSSGRGPAAASASVITYSETWSIEGLPTRPVFRRLDYMSGARTESMEGITEYAATEVKPGGNAIFGSYVRDSARHGTFRMMRSGEAGALKSQKTQAELQRQAAVRTLSQSAEARAEIETEVDQGLTEYGIYLSSAAVQKMVDDGFALASQGVPLKEIEERLTSDFVAHYWSFVAPGAVHDDGARYRYPFDPATPRKLLKGVGEPGGPPADPDNPLVLFDQAARHSGWSRYAFKFALPEGTPVLAARDGTVERVVDGFEPGGSVEVKGNANAVWVKHADGTVGMYLDLQEGIPVRPGAEVKAGDVLGRASTPGYLPQSMVHFSVLRVDEGGRPESVDIRFDDGSPDGEVPVEGRAYPGG